MWSINSRSLSIKTISGGGGAALLCSAGARRPALRLLPRPPASQPMRVQSVNFPLPAHSSWLLRGQKRWSWCWQWFYWGPESEVGEGNGNPLQDSCLENPVDGGAWWAAVHRVAQSWTRLKRLSMHACIGEGNGNPLQCSCLENPRDGGAWWAAVYWVAQSRTRLKRLSSSISISSRVRNAGALGILPCWAQLCALPGGADRKRVLRLLLCRAGRPCLVEDNLVNLSSAALTRRVDRGSASVDTFFVAVKLSPSSS